LCWVGLWTTLGRWSEGRRVYVHNNNNRPTWREIGRRRSISGEITVSRVWTVFIANVGQTQPERAREGKGEKTEEKVTFTSPDSTQR